MSALLPKWRAMLSLLLLLGDSACLEVGAPPFDPLDAEPPRLVETLPRDASVRVPPDAVVILAFSEGLAKGQPTLAQVRLASGALVPALGVQIPGPGRVRLVPVAPLPAGARFRLELDPAITDRAFNPIALEGEETVGLSFTVTAADDPLRVVDTMPAQGEVGLGLRPTLTIIFDVPLSALGLERRYFLLEESGGQAVGLRAEISAADDHRVELTPFADLAPTTDFVLTIDPALRDSQSRHLALPFVLTFTTGAG